MSVLERLGRVDPAYVHASKLARPRPSLVVGDAALKWYDVAPADAPVPREVRELARTVLAEAAEAGELTEPGDLGFAVLHRCGPSFHFLLACTWRNDNELWQTVWAKDGDDATFEPWVVDGPHRPTFCVWELGAVCHEQVAWSRYLRSRRDAAAKAAYLRTWYEGPV